MDRRYRYIPFSSQAWLYIFYDSFRRHNDLNNYPLTENSPEYHQGREPFHTTELPGASPQTEILSSKNWEAYNLGAR